MSAAETPEVTRAVELILAGASVAGTAKRTKIAMSTLRRALRRRGIGPRPHPKGPDHHAWIDGRTAARRQRAAGEPVSSD